MLASFGEDGALTALGTIWEWIELGGPVVAILLILSIIALAVILLKLYQFSRAGTVVSDTVSSAVEAFCDRRVGDAESMLRGERGLAVEIIGWTIDAKQTRSFNPASARENVTRLASDHLASLRQHFRTLEVIASLAPLLGLFGTVLGMIEAFRELEAAGSQVDPSLLSGGIWEALLTTAVGLAVAIPTVAILNLLEQRVDSFAHQLDSLISRLFTGDAITSEASAAYRISPTADASLQPTPLPGA
ncbi:MAG: MotA/TolQ/ExbB proton channel family protein [Pseudomonadota bacterium]